MAESSLVELYFPALTGGTRAAAPPRSLQDPGGPFIWRDSMNVIVRDGMLRGRPTAGAGPGYPTLPQPTWDLGANDTGHELPRFIDCSRGPAGDFFCLVTDRSIWIRPSAAIGWVNCTPTYTTGTITATNGSPNITGAGGMLWQTHGITANQFILIDGTHYKISAVTGETAITLASNFTGATAAGKAYVIRRMWNGAGFADSSLIFCTIYNENLYVAGTYIGGAAGAVAPAVIKVANIYSATPTTTYLTGGSLLSAGLDYISGLTRIAGIGCLQDGRVVFAGNTAEVFYSSNLSDAVWTVAPAGSTPLAEVDNPIRAQGRIGATLTFHRADGVVLGHQTGLSDPPLNFQNAEADYGCVAPLTLKSFLGGEVYLASDGDVKLFDGHVARSLGNGEMSYRTRRMTFTPEVYCYYHGAVFSGRNEYILARGADGYTWTYQADGDRWWPGAWGLGASFSGVVGAFSDVVELDDVPSNVAAVIGARDNLVHIPPGTDLLHYYVEDNDGTITTGESGALGAWVETDVIDHGHPLRLKTPQRVIWWREGVGPATQSVRVNVKRPTDSSYVVQADDISCAKNGPSHFILTPGQSSGTIPAGMGHSYKITIQADQHQASYSALLIRVLVGGDAESV